MNKPKFLTIFILALFNYSPVLFGQTQFAPRDGLIPKSFGGAIAEDLVYQGQNLTPEQLYEEYQSWNGELDLSELNPIETTSYWANTTRPKTKAELADLDNEIQIKNFDTIQFMDFAFTADGEAQLSVMHNQGDFPFYTLHIGPLIHQYLMRKTLLRKIGYSVPSMKRVGKLKLQFSSLEQKQQFKDQLEYQQIDIDNWVIHDDPTQAEVIVQDIVITKAGLEAFYNLSIDAPKASLTKRWRLFTSLSIPYNILNYPESVNLFKWYSCRVFSKNVQLQLDDAPLFNTTYEDARWISRKIADLSRQDWKEIVESSQLPGPVQAVLLEKLIARRNNNNRCFDIDKAPLILHPKVNAGEYVVDSKILKGKWEGYGPQFSFKDPESPLSSSEMTSFLLSRAYSLMFRGFAQAFNDFAPFMRTDFSGKNNEAIQKILAEHEAESLITGEQKRLPVSTWMYPHFRANIIIDRQVVTGPYQGTDNILSQVDTLGFSFSAGQYLGVVGILPNQTNDVLKSSGASATLAGQVSRIYSHITPVSSIKTALKKYPFKNAMIPFYKKRLGKIFQSVQDQSAPDISNVRDKLLEELKQFKDTLKQRESLIITDRIGAALGSSASFKLYNFVQINPSFLADSMILNRVHIYRKDENTLHIYKNFGNVSGVQVNLDLNAGLPVISATMQGNRGKAKTDMYILSINPEHENIEQHVLALKKLLITGSLKKLKAVLNPYRFKYKFREKSSRLGIFAFHFNRIRSANNISITGPDGGKREYSRHYLANISGTNVTDYALKSVETLADLLINTNLNLASPPFNPGFQYLGRAKVRELVYEVENKKEGKTDAMIRITRAYNGWKHSAKKVQQKLTYLRNHYRYNFYDPYDLTHAVNIYLYNINVNIFVYQKGIDHLLSMPKDDLIKIYQRYLNKKYITNNPPDDTDSNAYQLILRWKKRYSKYIRKNKPRKAINNLLKIFNHMEKRLTIRGFALLVGGSDNFYVYSSIKGFREGEEFNRDRADVLSHSLGTLGTFGLNGPLSKVQRKTGITPGELHINWIMRRAL